MRLFSTWLHYTSGLCQIFEFAVCLKLFNCSLLGTFWYLMDFYDTLSAFVEIHWRCVRAERLVWRQRWVWQHYFVMFHVFLVGVLHIKCWKCFCNVYRLRKDEVSSLSGPNEFAEFYLRLKGLKDFHKKHPNEVSHKHTWAYPKYNSIDIGLLLLLYMFDIRTTCTNVNVAVAIKTACSFRISDQCSNVYGVWRFG